MRTSLIPSCVACVASFGVCVWDSLSDVQVLGNLRDFSVANRFQKAALIAVAYQLTAEDKYVAQTEDITDVLCKRLVVVLIFLMFFLVSFV